MVTPIKDIQFTDVNVFYNFVFDIGRTVNPIDEARRLLRTDLGIATPNYLTNEIEIASRFNSLLTVQETLRHLAELDSVLQKEGLKAFTKGVLRHPKLVFNMWRSTRARKRSTITVQDKDQVESAVNDKQKAYSIIRSK